MAAEEGPLELSVLDVIRETEDACSVVFDSRLDFRPGQFLTLAVPSDRTGLVARCYSLCSVPGEPLTVTVKRTAHGYASNWINDRLRPGDRLRVLEPSGIFSPASLDADLLLFAGGSGITPVMSIARSVLERGTGRIVLLYANRDERSVIFAGRWAALAAEHPDRLQVVHWLESVQGLPTQEQLRAFAAPYADREAFVCGPAPFMTLVTGALRDLGLPRSRRHQEKFVSLGGNPFGDVEEVLAAQAQLSEADDGDDPDEAAAPAFAGTVSLEVELDGQKHTFDDWDGSQVLLEYLEGKGVDAPFSCREGNCSSCACIVLEGDIAMKHNEVLDAEDLADGIRLTCQALPLTELLRISYNG
jgi:3-ketosteroid 9alpha-monooxygenase subunit B